MKLGIYSDPHFSQSSSIIVGKKGKFSGRLENLIKSYEWMDSLFKKEEVDMIFCLGDLTDKPNLSAEEITAISKCPGIHSHYFIVGNHCRSNYDGSINSLSIFNNVFYEPTIINIHNHQNLLILPYGCTENPFEGFYKGTPIDIVLSHNDIKGYQTGKFTGTEGLDTGEVLDKCKLLINGHLHNGGWVVKNRIMNIGQLSGMNFSSCGGEWEPSVAIVDTKTLSVSLYENPEAYRFKKLEFNTLTKVKNYLDSLVECQGKYVLQVKVPDNLSDKVRKLLSQSSKVEASRVITYQTNKRSKSQQKKEEISLSETSGSVYSKLKDFIGIKGTGKYNSKKIDSILESLSKGEGEL